MGRSCMILGDEFFDKHVRNDDIKANRWFLGFNAGIIIGFNALNIFG